VAGWRDYVLGDFMLVKCLKASNHFMQLDDPFAIYGVKALNDPLTQIFADAVPAVVRTVLLPYKGEIVYDGLLALANVSFGRNYLNTILDSYHESLARFGLITSLPADLNADEPDPEKLLRTYLRSVHSREMHEFEIQDLIAAHPELLPVYHQEQGKVMSRHLKRKLKELGLSPGEYYAVLDSLIVAIAPSQAALKKQLKARLPKDKLGWVHCFKLK
ncbi:MAG: hypothetical protein ACAI44_32365, partial [Candidatus Sericytochromatia bacterium]